MARKMRPGRTQRPGPRGRFSTFVVRVSGSVGAVGVGILLGWALTTSGVSGWIVGLVCTGLGVGVSTVLWSRDL